MKTYTVAAENTALGVSHVFNGPGLSRGMAIHFLQTLNGWATECCADRSNRPWQDSEADRVLAMLKLAYEAGKRDAKAELKSWIG